MNRRHALRAVVLFYVGILVGLPIAYLLWRALDHGIAAWWHQVSAAQAVGALRLSLVVAVIAVPCNTAVGVVGAVLLARHRFLGRRVLDLLYDVPVAVSPVIIGVALVLAYSRLGWFGTWLATYGVRILFTPLGIILASAAVSLPYVLRSVLPVLLEIGEDAEKAASTLGAGRWRVFFTITLPAIRWAVLYGVTLTLARTMGEFGAVLVVSGNISGQTQTLPIYIYDQWDQSMNALGSFSGALVLAAVSVAALVVTARLRKRERSRFVDHAV